MTSRKFYRLVSGAAGVLLCGTMASAADVDAVSKTQAAEPAGLETIVVTAQKRAENIQTVPISITAVTAQAIEASHTFNIEALTGQVPNVQIGHFSNTPTGAVFSIRGMGVIEPDPYAGQTVTVVLDGVPQVFNMTSLSDLFDVERVEILRGPQGTLFGANTTGGVINVITRQPTGKLEGRAQASVGNYHRLDGDAALDFPIMENVLAGKVVFTHHQQDGFVTNVYDGSSMGDLSLNAMRGILKWTPNESFDAILAEQIDQGRGGSPIVVAGDYPGEAEYVAPGTQPPGSRYPMYQSPCASKFVPCQAPDEYFSANNSVPDKTKYNQYGTTLSMNWRGPIGEVVSITGYKRFEEDNYTDQDGTPLTIDDTHRTTNGFQLSEELRDTIHPVDNVRLLLGAFSIYDYYHHIQNFRIPGLAGGAPISQIITQDQIRRSNSIFAQAYWDVTSKLRFQAGVRGTKETTRMLTDTNLLINLAGPDAVFYGATSLSDAVGYGQKSWTNVGGKIGIDYQWTDHIMTYGYVARGFKSGGFVGRITLPQSIGPYGPEHVNTFEIGLKADWLDNRLRTNLSVFYNQYKDLQIAEIIFIDTPNGRLNDNSIVNAANATTKGVEFEVTAVPIENLTLNASFAYLSAKYKDFCFPGPGAPGVAYASCAVNATTSGINLSGADLNNAPKATASGGIRYRIPVGAGEVTLGVQDRYTAKKFLESIVNTPRSTIQATNFVDVNGEWSPNVDGKVSFNVWARNVADKRYIASVYDAPGTLGLVNYDLPREFGLTVSYKW